jgi:hypothetical protein
LLKRFNDGLARGEAAIAVGMLLLMIVVAFAQALFRNLTNFGMGWANVALSWLDWADFILSKGTLWLAFLGASLAVYEDKHVAIDMLPKLVSPKTRMLMRIGVGLPRRSGQLTSKLATFPTSAFIACDPALDVYARRAPNLQARVPYRPS